MARRSFSITAAMGPEPPNCRLLSRDCAFCRAGAWPRLSPAYSARSRAASTPPTASIHTASTPSDSSEPTAPAAIGPGAGAAESLARRMACTANPGGSQL